MFDRKITSWNLRRVVKRSRDKSFKQTAKPPQKVAPLTPPHSRYVCCLTSKDDSKFSAHTCRTEVSQATSCEVTRSVGRRRGLKVKESFCSSSCAGWRPAWLLLLRSLMSIFQPRWLRVPVGGGALPDKDYHQICPPSASTFLIYLFIFQNLLPHWHFAYAHGGHFTLLLYNFHKCWPGGVNFFLKNSSSACTENAGAALSRKLKGEHQQRCEDKMFYLFYLKVRRLVLIWCETYLERTSCLNWSSSKLLIQFNLKKQTPTRL